MAKLGLIAAATAGSAIVLTTVPQAYSGESVVDWAARLKGDQSTAAAPAAASSENADTPTTAELATVRSALYPTNWQPMHSGNGTSISTANGPLFLHDFSYAGYGRGEASIPTQVGPMNVNVAAPTGNDTTDTAAIQSAISQACSGGGGTVNLQAGTYAVKPSQPIASGMASILIPCSKLILRGKGAGSAANEAGKTYIYNTEPNMRMSSVIAVESTDSNDKTSMAWYQNIVGTSTAFGSDTTGPTVSVTLATTPAAANIGVGDKIILRTTMTDAFRAEHNMTPSLWPSSVVPGLLYLRKVTAINNTTKTITLEAPIPYPMKIRDSARVYKTATNIYNVGIESLSIGMKENTLAGTADGDWNVPGTGGYQMHGANLIKMNRVEGAWIRYVRSYRPSANTTNIHMLSQGINLLRSTRLVTIDSTYMARPAYRGEGGNGYMYSIAGMDNLIQDAAAYLGRHNFMLQEISASGNVFLRCKSTDARFPSDTHRGLSHANLFDSCTLNDDHFQSANRTTLSGGAGSTGTQNVFWNTIGSTAPTNNYLNTAIILSAQAGWGYIIGTSGSYSSVYAPASGSISGSNITADNTSPADYQEHIGQGASLAPQSLYQDQLSRR